MTDKTCKKCGKVRESAVITLCDFCYRERRAFYMQEYRKKPEVKEYLREYRKKPEVKEKTRALCTKL